MAEPAENRGLIENVARGHGIDLVGVADVQEERSRFHGLPETVTASLPYAVSLAARVSPTSLETVIDGPSHIYFHHYRQLNYLLDRAALAVARAIEAQGHRALAVAASQVIEWEQQWGHVSHRNIAILAGLGWHGRNNLLVTPQYGSGVRLVSVLTDLPLEPGTPLGRDCGSCHRCQAGCPAQAIKSDVAGFDRMACFAKLKEFSKTRGIGQQICGLCVRACSKPAGG